MTTRSPSSLMTSCLNLIDGYRVWIIGLCGLSPLPHKPNNPIIHKPYYEGNNDEKDIGITDDGGVDSGYYRMWL